MAGRGALPLPGLAPALDPAIVSGRLAPLVGGDGALTVRLLKEVPGKRAVLGFAFANGRRAVGKIYRKDRAERQAQLLGELGAVLRQPARVARVLDCWTDLGLVVQEWVPGTPLPEWTELGNEPGLVEQLGTALARLHAARVALVPAMDLEAHLRRTCHPGPEALAADRPELGRAALDLGRRILVAERQLRRAPVTCHGDFGPRQAFVNDGDIWFVDLDGLCGSDAAFDVAHFTVGLEIYLGPQAEAPRARFLAAYGAAGGRVHSDALAVHAAFCDLRRAIVLWRKRTPGWESDCARALARGSGRL